MVAETFEKLVKTMTEQKASDLFLTVGLPPCIKLNGSVVPIGEQRLDHPQVVHRRLPVPPRESDVIDH